MGLLHSFINNSKSIVELRNSLSKADSQYTAPKNNIQRFTEISNPLATLLQKATHDLGCER
jgi:hypothetical protein